MSKKCGALDGVRVLDFSAVIAGPFATRLMADLGAEVIKIEPPGGDLLRSAMRDLGNNNPYFGQTNCGKKSLCIDLKTPGARELILQLVDKADVLVQNFRPGVMRDYGLAYEDLIQRKPDIIYASISGYGQHGPSSTWAAYAPVIHAASGYDMAILSYQHDLDKPLNGANAMADYLAASLTMGAISAALLKKEKTGEGEEIDISMMEVMQNTLAYEIQEKQFEMERLRPDYGPVKTNDGFIIVTPVSPKNFRDLANAVGHPEWLELYPLFTADRVKHWSLVMAELEKWTLQRSAIECEKIIREGGCPCSRYRDVWESMHDEQTKARDGVVEIDDGAGGSYLIPTTPLRLMQSVAKPNSTVPSLGGNNLGILQSWLGFSELEVNKMEQSGLLIEEID